MSLPLSAPALAPGSVSPGRSPRIASLDIVRGIAMLLMAIDHVRVYSGLPPGGPTPGIFFTRWITHFVAPTFVFLAGTGIYLHGQKLQRSAALSTFLLTRGLWLVLLELTVIRIAWTFNLDFAHYMLAGVIWMIGWCMVLMAALIYLGPVANAVGGCAIIAFHNVTNFFPEFMGQLGQTKAGWLWKILYLGGGFELGASGPPLLVLFVIVPWIGVMMAGYGFGQVMRMPAERRRRITLRLGTGAVIAFLVLRTLDVYGDPRHWSGGALSFLGTSKYPASLQFLLMTLGPMFIGLCFTEGAHGWLARTLATFGRVPLFYYLLHIPLIHAAACVVSLIREGAVNPWLFTNHPMAPGPVPDGYTWSLPMLYLVFAIVILLLYFPCRWFAEVKRTNRSDWLSYF
ncbi:MAG: heparan-alpha-glucosaminide N-acetyltransferase domain-containing protein [Gemmatimonadota bacterium]